MRTKVFAIFCVWMIVCREIHSFSFPSMFRRKPKVDGGTVNLESISAEEARISQAKEKAHEEIAKLEELEEKLQEKKEANGGKGRELSDVSSSELIERVEKTQTQRRKLKVMVFAYSIARMLMTVSPILAFTSNYAFYAFRGFIFFVEQLVMPLDSKYTKHRREYKRVMAHLRKTHPDQKVEDEVVLKNSKGRAVKVKIIDTKDPKKKANIPLHKLEPVELMHRAWNLK